MEKIKDYENYEIHKDESRVFNTDTKKYLKNCNGRGGYAVVYLYKGPYGQKKKKAFSIHKLMGEYYLTNPNNLPIVDHVDHDKKNNNISNLRWATHSLNRYNKSTAKKGYTFCKDKGLYRSSINYNKKTYFLGHFESPEECIEAKQKKSLELYGFLDNIVNI